jgi:hypothetical protein
MIARRLVDVINRNPVVRFLKNARSQLVDLSYRARARDEAAQLVSRLTRSNVRNACFTVAFNVPWAIRTMIAAWRRFPIGHDLVVANNSSNSEKREEIKALCQQHDIPHVNLPRNPEWNPCRSHGIAMNWLFYNVVRHLRLETFGFLDHDCFPLRPFDVTERLRRCDVYGLKFQSTKFPDIWNMWAGFCFYRGPRVRNLDMDFKPRVEFGLDTGGGNWNPVYSDMHPQRVSAAEFRFMKGDEDFHITIDEAFLHVGGASFRSGNLQRAMERIQRLLDCDPPANPSAWLPV